MDHYDKKILKLLTENCRYNISDIAKAVNLSKDSVKNRIKKLEEEEIITRYSVLFNPRKFGYTITHLLLKLRSQTPQEEKKSINAITKNKHVTFISSQSGVYDLQIIFHTKNSFQKEEIIKQLLNTFKQKVRDYEIVEHIHDYNFSFIFNDIDIKEIKVNKKNDTSFSKGLEKNKTIHTQVPKEIITFSQTEKEIAKELTKNPRAKLTQIGQKIGITSQGVKKRIQALIEKEAIYQFSLFPNHETLNLFNYMLMFKIETLPKEKLEELNNYLITNNFILFAAKMEGAYNLFVYTLAKTPIEFNNQFKTLKRIIDDYIINYDLSILTKVHKFTMISEDFLESE